MFTTVTFSRMEKRSEELKFNINSNRYNQVF